MELPIYTTQSINMNLFPVSYHLPTDCLLLIKGEAQIFLVLIKEPHNFLEKQQHSAR